MTVQELYDYCVMQDWEDKEIAIQIVEQKNYTPESITNEYRYWETDLDVDVNENDEVYLS